MASAIANEVSTHTTALALSSADIFGDDTTTHVALFGNDLSGPRGLCHEHGLTMVSSKGADKYIKAFTVPGLNAYVGSLGATPRHTMVWFAWGPKHNDSGPKTFYTQMKAALKTFGSQINRGEGL